MLNLKTLSKLLAPCAFALALTACGGDKPAESTEKSASPTGTSSSAAAPTSGDVIKIITTGKEPPFSMTDEKGNLSGIDIDVMNAIAASQGLKVEFQDLPWQRLLPAIEKGEYPVAINAIKYSDERANLYDLSNPYFFDPSALAYKTGSVIAPKSLNELSGVKVGVMKKSKQEADMANTGAVVVPYDSLFAAYKDMILNKVDVVAYDLPVLQMTAKQQANNLTFIPYESESDKGASTVIAVQKGNAVLLDKINRGIDELKVSGKINEIAKKHIGQ